MRLSNNDPLKRFVEDSSWNQLPLSFWELCQTYGQIRHYAAKKYLFFSGESAVSVYFLLKGRVELILVNESTEKIFRVVQAPIFLAEVVLDGKNYPYAALAVEDSEALVLDKKILLRYITENPSVLNIFYRNMALDLRRAYRQIKNVTLGDARSRLGDKLFALAHAHAHAKGIEDGSSVTIPLSTTELAGMCNLTRESVSRILGELKQQKIITVERKKIKILDKELLRDMVHERLRS